MPDRTSLLSPKGITRLGLLINVLLGLTKCLTGWLAGSRALLADGIHSLTDLAGDIAVLFTLDYAEKPRDLRHPYGHQKFASMVALFIALLLLAFCIGLLFECLRQLHRGPAPVPGQAALWVAAAALLAKELLYHATAFVARRFRSRLLLANAWHHRTDSATSLLALIGIGLAIWGGPGWALADTLVGFLLAAYLAIEGGKLLRGAVNDLVDSAPDPDTLEDLREHILPTPGVVAYHAFRARRAGDRLDVDLHLQVRPELSVGEGHAIARRVKENILHTHPEVMDVLIHLEPATGDALVPKGVSGSNPTPASPPHHDKKRRV
ncbi:MAG: cation transporter [Puniceicoccaceae bacterium]|nr:MAG: cation transporter [Puniceicoccaceae bacterium]